MELKTKPENLVGGIVGAFLGSLIGVACIVILGQLGYVAAISGAVMAVCALKGCEMLGGTLSKKGIAISCVLILLMTYLANKLDWAISAASVLEVSIPEAFQAINPLLEMGAIEGSAYWGNLAMLYLFTLLGAVPTVINGIKNANMPDAPQAAAGGEMGPGQELTFYPAGRGWTRPLRLSTSLAMFVPLIAGLVLMTVGGAGENFPLFFAAAGCILSAFATMLVTLPQLQLCQAEMLLFARSGRTLWQVNLNGLNFLDTYRFTKRSANLTALRWDRLTDEDQARCKASVARAAALLQSGQVMPGSALSRAVLALNDLEIEKENDWCWKGRYTDASGKRRRIAIAKAFPNMAPLPGMEPPAEPVPWRWGFFALALVLALVMSGAGWFLGASGDTDAPGNSVPDSMGAPSGAQTAAEDYRSRFHLAEEYGYLYVGCGYIKAPDGMFDYANACADVFVPYSDAPEYLDGGYTIRSAAHGMEVTVTMASGTAREIVDAAYEALAASGAELFDDTTSETQYAEEYDAAYKQVVYLQDDELRAAVLYACPKAAGAYLSVQIIYLLEQTDADYLPLLAELGDAYGLSLPELDPVG